MSLIAYGNDTASPLVLDNNGFWPDIDVANCREAERIDTTVPDARLSYALQVAMADINRQLANWQEAREAEDAASIDDVPVPKWQLADAYSLLYRRAVYATAHADVLERYRDMSATRDGDDKGEGKDLAAEDYRRAARWAVSEITGSNHSTVELI